MNYIKHIANDLGNNIIYIWLVTCQQALPQCYTKLAPVDGCKPDEGEICMKGRSVFMGYLHMPEKTSETVRKCLFIYLIH